MRRSSERLLLAWLVGVLLGCAASVQLPPDEGAASVALPAALSAPEAMPSPTLLLRAGSRWRAVAWSELPGFAADDWYGAWDAWLRSCQRPTAAFALLCSDVRRLSIASVAEQRDWLQLRLQAYQVEDLSGSADGLLTAYFEPELDAERQPSASFGAPLYQPPLSLRLRQPWYTREQADTLEVARTALRGREIAYLESPVDALMVQVQGSARLRIHEPDGRYSLARVAFAASNEQGYQSVARWLLERGLLRDLSWPAIKAWAQQNPQRIDEMLRSNPRLVFFREEALSGLDGDSGPRGAQGVALTAGRSIAVDATSIPLGTPVWLASSGALPLQKLVLAQDRGNAIVGAVRADYFVGSGAAAGALAGRLKQGLRLWALWPKSLPGGDPGDH